jgi:branched-chain amino acid transport system permease protein
VIEGFAQPITNGILVGGLYAVVGIGMAMIFGILRLTNLAHGDLMIVGSYLSLATVAAFGINPLLTLVIVLPVMFFIGFFLQGQLLNRVLGKGMEPPLLISFGVSIILQNALLSVFTPDARSLSSGFTTANIRVTDHFSIPMVYLVDCVIGAIVILVLHQFLKRTYVGRAIRAASDDEVAAKLTGINTKRIYSYAMGIAMVTAGVAGVLVGITFPFYPHTGTQFLIIAFGVVVIGGLESMIGTLLAGMILGLAQTMGAHFFGTGVQLLMGYLVLLLVLALRPQGLFARG